MRGIGVKRGVIGVVLISFIALILFGTSIQLANAFGISTPYLENNVLRVNPGKTYAYVVTLQNGDEEDYYVDIEYGSTNNIVGLGKNNIVSGTRGNDTITNNTFFVKNETYNTAVTFTITIPPTTKIGEKYILTYSAKPRVSGSGTVTMGVKIERYLNIIVVDENAIDVPEYVETPTIQESTLNNNTGHNKIIEISAGLRKTGKYILLIILIGLLVLIFTRLWSLSKWVSSRLHIDLKSNYTISEASSLEELYALLKRLSEEEFEVPEIKQIFRNKISELTKGELSEEIMQMSLKEFKNILSKLIWRG